MAAKSRKDKQGLPPGSLIYIGEEKKTEVVLTLIDYSETHYEEKTVRTMEECLPYANNDSVTWLNVSGIHDVDLINRIGNHFSIHPLLLEDILNSEHRPKLSYFNNNLLLILKRFDFDFSNNEIIDEQISCFLGENIVITFQENEYDDFDPIRRQIRDSIGNIREQQADFLLYRLIDNIVDHYVSEVEKIYDRIELLEEQMVMAPSESLLHDIYDFKSEVIKLRKLTWPVREAIAKLERRDIPLISNTTRLYLSDIHEHLIHMNDLVETTRSLLAGLLDIYFSSMSTKMNEVMKVLTMVSTIFIPLTFIAGIYGMNFAFMPELHWKIGYPVILLVMLAVTCMMIIYFKKKKWL